MIEVLNRAADNLCSEGWDEEAAAVRKVADHIEELEKFKSIHAKCDEVSLELEQKLILQLAGCHRENERLREALALADAALSGANMNMKVVEKKIRAALAGEKAND